MGRASRAGICAAATHGVIRTGHAARSLEQRESPLRVRELAEGLGYWAATYEELPGDDRSGELGLSHAMRSPGSRSYPGNAAPSPARSPRR